LGKDESIKKCESVGFFSHDDFTESSITTRFASYSSKVESLKLAAKAWKNLIAILLVISISKDNYTPARRLMIATVQTGFH
jgi:hypothetical protein